MLNHNQVLLSIVSYSFYLFGEFEEVLILKGKSDAYKAPAKRSQHVNATYRNMLRAFGHRVAMYCSMLGVVGSTGQI